MIDHKSSYLATSNLRSTFDIDKNAISRILDRLTPGIDAFQYQKPNNRELNLMELNYNHAHSSERSKVERYFGLLKVRFSFLLDGYRGPIRQFYRLFRLACVIMNIVFATNSVREEEEPLIEFVIRTQVRWTSTEELRLVNNSIADTFPEVRISDTGEHSIVFDAEREETSFQSRNRRVRNIQPAFEYQGPSSQRGSNRIERVLVRTREEYEQGNNDQLDQRPQNRRRITNLNDLLN